MGIIDVHVHHNWTDPQEDPSPIIQRDSEYAAANGIDRIVLLSLVRDAPPSVARQRNDLTLGLMRRAPDLYFGAMYLEPRFDPGFIREEMRRCAEAGFIGVKMHVSADATDPRQDVLAETAAELDIPLMFHCWYKVTGKLPGESEPCDIANLARRHPETKIVMFHLPGTRHRGVLDIEDLPNVSVDTSGSWPGPTGLVEYAVRHLGPDRVMYGSDYPGRDFSVQTGRVLGADLSDEVKEKILRHNAIRILKLRC